MTQPPAALPETSPEASDLQQLAQDLSAVTWALARRLRAEGSTESSPSLGQLAILSHLERQPGLTGAQVAREEMVTPQSVNTALAELRGRQLIEVQPVKGDGRRLALFLTPAGQQVLEETRQRRSLWLVEFLGQMTPAERQQLAEALAALRRTGAAVRAARGSS